MPEDGEKGSAPSDPYHRCLFCPACLPQGEPFISHVKDHLSQCRPRSSSPQPHRRLVKKLKKRRKKRKISLPPLPNAAAAAVVPPVPVALGHVANSDDCLGDSELSDTDDEDDRREQLEKERREMKTILARTRLSLAEKQLDTGEAEDLVCLTCLKKFSNIQNLRRHLRLHIARDSHIPDVDSDTDNPQSKLKFSCDFCPEKFANKAAYMVHDKSHGDQQPECYVCGKKYADRYSLRYHLRTHGIGHQIRCELCNKSFPKPSRLQAHINAFHKNIRNFTCSHCDKSFKTRLHLENHALVHTGEKPHHCPTCGDQFRHKVSLVAHLRIHDDVRPYVCHTCGKSFREPSTLTAHMRVHSGDKPYKCDECDKSFTQRAGLNYHKSVHAGLKPYRCTKCDYSTAKPNSLRAHQKSVHNIELKEAETGLPPLSELEADRTANQAPGPAEPLASTMHQPPSGLGADSLSLSSGLSLPSSVSLPLTSTGSLSLPSSGGLTLPSTGSLPLPSSGSLTLPSTGSLPLPSPPLQEGDAVLRDESQGLYGTQQSNSLPSFNILKSYESTPTQGAVMSTPAEEECGMSERASPYSQPSLSPPLTPPTHQQYYQHAYAFPPAAPLNYSTHAATAAAGYRECGGTTGFLDHHAEYFQRSSKLGGEYCSGLRGDQARETYYDYNYYQSRPINSYDYHHQ